MRRKRSARRALKRVLHAPPLRNGINASEIRLPEFDANGNPVEFQTLGQWAEAGWGEAALAAFAHGDYLADGNVQLSADTPYCAGQRIWVFRPVLDEPEQPVNLSVVAENERYLVVEKPHGMATIPRGSHVANTVTVAARRQFHNDSLVAAHRLDLETAGLVLLTKAPEYRAKYQLVFQNRRIQKTYLAVAPLLADFANGGARRFELPLYRPSGEIGVAVLSQNATGIAQEFSPETTRPWQAITEIRLLREVSKTEYTANIKNISRQGDFAGNDAACENNAPAGEQNAAFASEDAGQIESGASVGEKLICSEDFAALPEKWGIYQLQPHSGYMHQLRVTMNHLGAPIFGDPLYPLRLSKEAEAARDFPLQLLAQVLEFDDPFTGEQLHFVSNQRLALDFPAEH